MLRLDPVRAHILGHVGGLHRVGNAADFSAIIESNKVPTRTPVAFVVTGGLLGKQARIAAGAFIQDFDEAVSVILMDRVNGDPLGDKALEDLSPLVANVIQAVCGWAPDGAVGVFQLQRAELVGVKDRTLVFQIDFALNDQLRITK